MKKIVLFSYNPVPTPQYKQIEGSALRFWRMAQALRSRGYNDITIAIWEKFPQKLNHHEGIKLVNFIDDYENISKICNNADTVIFTCAMGPLSISIANAVGPQSRVIIDAYSPMYVEFLTKSQDQREDEALVDAYREYANPFDKLLIAADHILIANDHQKHFYRGVLAGISALPNHDDSRFVTFPAYVEIDQSVTDRVKISNPINILWFGGVYPWFDISDIIDIFNTPWVKEHAKLTIVGGSNPFYPKDNMRYNGKYLQAVELARENDLLNKVVFFEDWVQYDERVEKVFNQADVAVSINSDFIENEYSFRLRVADLAGNGVPIITNGGDYLGEYLIRNKVAFKLDLSNKENLKKSFQKIIRNRRDLEEARVRLRGDIGSTLHINSHIDKVISCIESTKPLTKKDITNGYLDMFDRNQHNLVHADDNLTLDNLRNTSTRQLMKLLAMRLKKSAKDRIKNASHK